MVERASITDIANEVRTGLRRNRVVFLVGAGVSMLGPSALPSGPALKRRVIDSIANGSQFGHEWRCIRRRIRFHRIVPEIIFQRIYEHLGERLYGFFQLLDGGTPNEAHYWLAHCSSEYRAVLITTNFDVLLERAGARGSNVLHAHGSIDVPAEMVFRINRVGLGLATPLTRDIRALVRGRTLCILGYSGLDKDVIDAVNAARPRRVLWLARNRADVVFQSAERLKCSSISVGIGDLQRLVKRIRTGRLCASQEQVSQPRSRAAAVERWKKSLSSDERFAAMSAVLFELGEYAAAARVAMAGVRLRSHERVQRAWFYRQAANAMKVEGQFEKALALATCVRRLKAATRYDVAAAWNAVGLVHLEKDRYNIRLARLAFTRAAGEFRWIRRNSVRTNQREQVEALRGRVYNNLGLALSHEGELGLAMEAFRRSLAVKRRTGDLIGKAQTAANVSIAYYREREFASAALWRGRALSLMMRYDLDFEKAYLLRQTGALACQQGRSNLGLRLLRQALDLYRSLPAARFGTTLTTRIIRQYTAKPASKQASQAISLKTKSL